MTNNTLSQPSQSILRVGVVCLVVLLMTSMVSAVWWNPFTWFDEDENIILEKNGKWILRYTHGIQDEYYDTTIENLDNGKAKICLLPKTNLKINNNIIKDSKATLKANNIETKIVEPSDMEVETEGGNVKKICVDVDKELNDYLKFGEHSTVITYENEVLEVTDSDNNKIGEIVLTTDDYIYKNNKPHKDYGYGKNQIIHEFKIEKVQNYSDIFDNVYFRNMKNEEIVEKNFTLKYLEYEVFEKNITGCLSNTTLKNETIVCDGYGVTDTYNKTEKVWYNLTPEILNSNNIITVGVEIYLVKNEYIDVGFDFAGVDIGIFWASWSSDLNTDLSVYYKMDEASGTIYDSTNNNVDSATQTSITYGETGIIENSLEFDGSNSYLTFTDDDVLDVTNALSISAWIYTHNGGGKFVVKPAYGSWISPYAVWAFGTGSDLKLNAWVNSNANQIYSTDAVTQNGWTHVVFTYDGTTERLYVDGSTSGTYSYSGTITTNNEPLYIGARPGPGEYFDGLVDEVGIWSRVLSESEIEDLYNGGDGITWTDIFGFAPSVTLTSPVDTANLTSSTVDHIATITDDERVEWVAFYLDGVLEQNSSSHVNGSYTFTETVTEGEHIWSILASDNASLTNQSSNWTYNYTQPPIYIDLLSPADSSTHDTPNVNVSCIAYKTEGVTQLNLTIDGVMNKTVTNSTPEENLSIDGFISFPEGNYTWGCQALNPETSAESSNRTFEVLYSNPVITLGIPANDSISLNTTMEFTFNVTDVNGINNISFYIDGVLSESNASGVNGSYSFIKTIIEGNYNWSVKAQSIYNKLSISDEWIFLIHTTSPSVVITYPFGESGYFKVGDNETLNYSITEPGQNLTEHLDSCWYEYNSANVSINCYGNSVIFPYVADLNEIKVYANDTYGLLAFDNTTWIYNLTEVSQTSPATSLESATETYTANVQYNEANFNIATAKLTINGSEFTGTRTTSGSDFVFTTIATMPSVDAKTNFSSYWTISLINAFDTFNYNLSTNNITVDLIDMSLCGDAFNVSFWNFTVLNETNFAPINSTFDVTFNVKKSGSTSDNFFNFSYDSGNESEFDFCMYPPQESYSVDAVIQLAKSGYVTKFYNFESVSITNATREDNLYMMSNVDSTSFIVHVVDVSSTDITDAEVRVQRFSTGTNEWLTTEILTTNYAGEAIGHILAEDADYRFLVYQSGVSIFNSSSTKITCSIAPCTVTLVITISLATGIGDIDNLESLITFSSTTDTFTYTYSDSDSDFSRARLYVIRLAPSNATIIIACNETKITAAGVMTCDITGQVNGTYQATGYIIRDSDEFLSARVNGNLGVMTYDFMGNDGVLWAIFVFIGIVMVGAARPSMGIVLGIIGFITLGLLQIISIGAISIVAIVTIGLILLIRVGRE